MLLAKPNDLMRVTYWVKNNKNLTQIQRYKIIEIFNFDVYGESNQIITILDDQSNVYKFDRRNQDIYICKLSQVEIFERSVSLKPLEIKIESMERLLSMVHSWVLKEEYAIENVNFHFSILERSPKTPKENALFETLHTMYFDENLVLSAQNELYKFVSKYLKFLQKKAKNQGMILGSMKDKYKPKVKKSKFRKRSNLEDEEEAVMNSFRNGTSENFGY